MKFWLILGVLTQFFLASLFVFAQGTNYLEFNPDQSSSLKVAEVTIPSQVFFAQNDFLGGFDLWVANPAMVGTATFDLLNDQGAIIATKTVTIATITETSSGTKLHVDFNSQVAVLSDKKYSIRITSSMPELRLYYGDRVQLIAYNAPFVSEYITGVGKLGSEEQIFSFKYALYETTESFAPIISNIAWAIVSPTQMRVDFNANEPVDYRIEYEPVGQGYTQNTNFTGGYQFCVPRIALCNLTISVAPSTTYQYLLTVKDSWGNQSQSNGTFTSGQNQTPTPALSPTGSPTPMPTGSLSVSSASPLPPPPQDKTSPIISNLRIVEVTSDYVKVVWTTNEVANSHLLISTSFLITITDVSDPTMELEHLLQIGNVLGPNINYVATVTSIDAGSNSAKASINFTTLAATSSLPQSSPISQPASQPQQVITTSSASSGSGSNTVTIEWSLPASGTSGGGSDGYRVDIFDKNGSLVKTVLVPKGYSRAEIPDLNNGEYSVIVYSNNNGVFEKIDQPIELKVGEPPFAKRLLTFWPYLAIVIVLGGASLWLRLRKKTSQITTQVVP